MRQPRISSRGRYKSFFALKDSLHAKGVKWVDAEMELVGYIWGAIEMDSIDDADIDDPN